MVPDNASTVIAMDDEVKILRIFWFIFMILWEGLHFFKLSRASF